MLVQTLFSQHQISNPFTDKQLNLLGNVPKQACHFGSVFVFCLGCKTVSRRAARLLIVLHPEQNMESELEWQTFTFFGALKCCSSVKGLICKCQIIIVLMLRRRYIAGIWFIIVMPSFKIDVLKFRYKL